MENIINLDDCVAEALLKKNHHAISQLILKIRPWKNRRFLDCFKKIYESGNGMPGRDEEYGKYMVNRLNDLVIIAPALWKSYTYEIKDLSDKYQDQTIKKWFSGEILPQREVIIQYALWLSFSIEETNLLLRSAGYHALYYANIYDIVAIYYLKNNHSVRKSLKEMQQIKHAMNQFVKLLYNVPEYGRKKINDSDAQKIMENICHDDAQMGIDKNVDGSAKDYYEVINGKTIFHPLKGMKLAYPNKMSRQLSHNVLGSDDVLHEDLKNNHGYLVTNYIKKNYFDHISNDDEFASFIKSNISLFGEMHYGLLQNIEMYLKDSRAYEKNLYNYIGSFDADDGGNIIDAKDGFLIDSADRMLKNQSIANKRNILTMLLSVTKEDLLDGVSKDRRAGAFSDINVLLDGRKEKIDKKSVYYYYHPTKTMLIRMLAALGREDEIGKIMIEAGYWDVDWIVKSGAENSEYLDASDLMMIYMIKYRNRLLETWAKKQNKNTISYINRNRKSFPFHKMMIEISDEIEKYFLLHLSPYEINEVRKYFPVPNEKKVNIKSL